MKLLVQGRCSAVGPPRCLHLPSCLLEDALEAASLLLSWPCHWLPLLCWIYLICAQTSCPFLISRSNSQLSIPPATAPLLYPSYNKTQSCLSPQFLVLLSTWSSATIALLQCNRAPVYLTVPIQWSIRELALILLGLSLCHSSLPRNASCPWPAQSPCP